LKHGKTEDGIKSSISAKRRKMLEQYVTAIDSKDYATYDSIRLTLMRLYGSMDKLNTAVSEYRKKQKEK